MSDRKSSASSFSSEGLFPIKSSSDDEISSSDSLEETCDITKIEKQNQNTISRDCLNDQNENTRTPQMILTKSKSVVQNLPNQSAVVSLAGSQRSSPLTNISDEILNKSKNLFEKYKYSSPYKVNRSPNTFQCKLQQIAAGFKGQSQNSQMKFLNSSNISSNSINHKQLNITELRPQEELKRILEQLYNKLNKINKQQAVIKQTLQKIKDKKKQISEQVQHKYILAQQNIIYQKQQIQKEIAYIQTQTQNNQIQISLPYSDKLNPDIKQTPKKQDLQQEKVEEELKKHEIDLINKNLGSQIFLYHRSEK